MLFEGWPTTNELDNADAREAAMKMPLSINDETVASREDALAMLAQKRSGRFTIRAPNGAGKSTFLRALKFTVGDGAFYLPAHTEGLTWEADLNGLSTGQKMVTHLNEVETLTAITHILLDEWDANLDQANTALFEQRLNASAQSRVIVEIRH